MKNLKNLILKDVIKICLKGCKCISSVKFVFQSDAFYGTGTISLNDKLALPQDASGDYDMNQLSEIQEMEIKKFEVSEFFSLLFYLN